MSSKSLDLSPTVRRFGAIVTAAALTFGSSAYAATETHSGSRNFLSIPVAVTVSGQVLDETGKGMPGVNIIEKGTTNGTSTDVDGKYTLSVSGPDATLVFTFIGYETLEMAVASQTSIDVTMKPDVSTLSEVVVIGYGTQKRASVTGAVSSVNQKEVAALPVPSVAQALQGRVAGVNVTNQGAPGAAPIVRIRGFGSITGSSEPLYVIDGIPSDGLRNIDAKDIESVDVLKDAASAAIYGSRAANGVILITTKTGAGKKGVSVNIETSYGTQSAWRTLDLLKRDQYLQYASELSTSTGGELPERLLNMDEPIYEGATQTYAQTETDWQDEIFRAAPIHQTNISVSSNSENLKLYTSVGIFGQDGIMVGTNFNRNNFRFNSEVNLSKRVSVGQTLTIGRSMTRNLQESGGRTIMQHVVRGIPYLPVYDPTNKGGFRAADNRDGSDPENPVRIMLMDRNQTTDVKVLGSAFVNVKFFDFLTYKFTLAADFATSRNRVDQPIYFDGFGGRNEHNLQDNRFQYVSPLYTNQLTFSEEFGKHAVTATVVAERQDTHRSWLNATGQQSSNAIRSIQAGLTETIARNDNEETTLLSYLGRINYEFAGKYLVSASLRKDGYSAFAPGNKWGTFPGASIGWRVSEESFMSGLEALSEFKLRASYGEMGVNNVGPFDFQSTISINATYPFNNSNENGPSGFFNSLPNEELSWETTTMTNFGVDLGLLDDKFTLSAEVFNRKVDNLLLDVPLAPSMGYSVNFRGNVGSMENKGFEVQAGYNKNSGDLNFNVSANIGAVRNKVTDLYTPGNTLFAGENADFGGYNITKTEVGHSVQGFYGWVVDGIFQNQEEIDAAADQDGAAPGDIRFKDLDGNGVINNDDRKYLGSFLPNFTYGLNLSATYKNFDLTLFLQGVQGNEVYNGTKVLTQGMLRLFGAETAVLDAWTPANTDTSIPRAINNDPNKNTRTSDRFIEDGSYMRLKNLNIGYTIPSNVLSSFAGGSIRSLRIYFSSQNLLTLTKYKGYDPEIGSRNNTNLIQGIDYGQYPQPRTIMGGIQIGL
jgi:TonB-dependent starch-binding outer membrane protein SusC